MGRDPVVQTDSVILLYVQAGGVLFVIIRIVHTYTNPKVIIIIIIIIIIKV